MTSFSRPLAALAFGLLAACSTGSEEPAPGAATSDLYARATALWPRPADGSPMQLTVCWKNPGQTIAYPRPRTDADDSATTTTEAEGWTQEAVAETWGRELNIDFVGWQPCVGGEDIPILIGDSQLRSKVDAFGRLIKDSQMELNLIFGEYWRFYQKHKGEPGPGIHFWVAEQCDNFSNVYSAAHPEFVASDTATFRAYYRSCLKGMVAHEFGHALGFLHEQYRQDGDATEQAAEKACLTEAQTKWGDTVTDIASVTIPGDTPEGPFDGESIMSYCRKDTTDQLTPTDIAFAASLYGRRTAQP